MGEPADAAVRVAFRRQAEACRALGSPFTGLLLDLLADRLRADAAPGAAVLGWAGDPFVDALPLRLAGALHALVLDGADPELRHLYPPAEAGPKPLWRAVEAALGRHAGWIVDWLGSAPQTNEVSRSAMLLPGLLAAVRATGLPVSLLEIGASAGLNMLPDRYAYDYAGVRWGDPAARPLLAPQVVGAPPPLDGGLEVHARAGCDINPLDPADPDHRLRLRAYVWPDQPARLQRLEAALAVAAADGTSVERADAAGWLEAHLATRRADVLTVVFHTVVWQYLPEQVQARLSTILDTAAADGRPLAWLRMEGVGGEGRPRLLLSLAPVWQTRELAICDWHGRSIRWLRAQ